MPLSLLGMPCLAIHVRKVCGTGRMPHLGRIEDAACAGQHALNGAAAGGIHLVRLLRACRGGIAMHGQGPMRWIARQVKGRPGRRLAHELLRAPAHHARALPSPRVLLPALRGRLHLMCAVLIRAPEQVQQVLIPRRGLLLLSARHAPVCRMQQPGLRGLEEQHICEIHSPDIRLSQYMQMLYMIMLQSVASSVLSRMKMDSSSVDELAPL